MSTPVWRAALEPVIAAFEELGVPYYIGGSVASSAYGVARATLDVDLVAALVQEHVAPLLARLEETYYIDEAMLRDAITRRRSCNLVHLASMVKIDIFVPEDEPFAREMMLRRRRDRLYDERDATTVFLASPEDVILHKILWFRMGGEASRRQWEDALGVLRVQGEELDRAYLERWADRLGLGPLLGRALEESRGF